MQIFRSRGRLSPGQKRALAADDAANWKWREQPFAELFADKDRPLLLDVGSGDGTSAIVSAEKHPDWNILAVDPYPPGIGGTLIRIREQGLGNVRAALANIRELLPHLPAQSCSAVRILFPDPWPKKRHRKRRLVGREFVMEIRKVMHKDALLLIATDDASYAEDMRELLSEPGWQSLKAGETREIARPETAYSRRAQRLGNRVFDLAYRKISSG